ncbi:glutamate racemase [Nitrincola tapanii]|uniref:Glutamate racemase n=1 Tax=Nitrincola tapanii TaxID=1708751 RepID=A0A5A9W965_9GAMM|nr:glutamate racemase [Nitrincola tapanii]
MTEIDQRPIALFDSGVGGLTVLNAIRQRLPNENVIYLGDTARVPYGTKSALSIVRYAEQALHTLMEYDIKALVIACNTASAVALEPLRAQYPGLCLLGVIEPGAEAACQLSSEARIGVIATESTVNNQAYQKAILKIRPEAHIRAAACSLFVALAEEGWHDGELVEAIIERSLQPLFTEFGTQPALDTLVLGCTHFPALKDAISKVVGAQVRLVDSADTAAEALYHALAQRHALNDANGIGQVRFLVTDGPERFVRVARNFYCEAIEASSVELVDIQHHAAAMLEKKLFKKVKNIT